jgi:hypothetical protein
MADEGCVPGGGSAVADRTWWGSGRCQAAPGTVHEDGYAWNVLDFDPALCYRTVAEYSIFVRYRTKWGNHVVTTGYRHGLCGAV